MHSVFSKSLVLPLCGSLDRNKVSEKDRLGNEEICDKKGFKQSDYRLQLCEVTYFPSVTGDVCSDVMC